MKNYTMQNDAMDTYKNRLLQDKGTRSNGKGESECILFCKRVGPNVFNIKDGVAVMAGVEDCYYDGVCMISDFTKVIFVIDQPAVGK